VYIALSFDHSAGALLTESDVVCAAVLLADVALVRRAVSA